MRELAPGHFQRSTSPSRQQEACPSSVIASKAAKQLEAVASGIVKGLPDISMNNSGLTNYRLPFNYRKQARKYLEFHFVRRFRGSHSTALILAVNTQAVLRWLLLMAVQVLCQRISLQ